MLYGSKNVKRSKGRLATLYVVRTAFLAALLTVGKLALSFVPNVEVVTLFVIVYGAALGVPYALGATLIFCAVEVALYGVGSWVLLYFLYWPALGLVAALTLRGRRPVLAVVIAVAGSAIFGFLSACCTTLFAIGNLAPEKLWDYMYLYWLRGLYFDLVHIISSAATVGALYIPLVKALGAVMPDAALKHRLRSKAVGLNFEYIREDRNLPKEEKNFAQLEEKIEAMPNEEKAEVARAKRGEGA